jgi:hypothetical protein
MICLGTICYVLGDKPLFWQGFLIAFIITMTDDALGIAIKKILKDAKKEGKI